eukprot:1474631-Rhodomonas_salina.1
MRRSRRNLKVTLAIALLCMPCCGMQRGTDWGARTADEVSRRPPGSTGRVVREGTGRGASPRVKTPDRSGWKQEGGLACDCVPPSAERLLTEASSQLA